MAKTRTAKQAETEKLTEEFKAAKGVVFVDYKGLTVKNVTTLRRQARAADVSYVVAKKTLVELAAKNAGYEIPMSTLAGNIAVAFGHSDEVAAARTMAEMSKTAEALKIVGGMLEGKLISAAEVKALAALPTRQQLLGQLAGVLNGPLTGLVGALAGIPRGLVTALHALEDQKQSA